MNVAEAFPREVSYQHLRPRCEREHSERLDRAGFLLPSKSPETVPTKFSHSSMLFLRSPHGLVSMYLNTSSPSEMIEAIATKHLSQPRGSVLHASRRET